MNTEIYKTGWDLIVTDSVKEEDYSNVIGFYENKINSEIYEISDYFYLGLSYLLNGQEDLAQMTWFSAIAEFEISETEAYLKLENILENEAQSFAKSNNLENSWLIRQYIREINPINIKNLFELISLSIKLKRITDKHFKDWDVVEKLRGRKSLNLEEDLINSFLEELLKFESDKTVEIVSELSNLFEDKSEYVDILLFKLKKIKHKNTEFSGKISKISSNLLPDNVIILHTTYWYYSVSTNYKEAINCAHQLYLKCKTPIWQLLALYGLIREKTRGGEWQDIDAIYSEYKNRMYQVVNNDFSEEDFLLKMSLSVIPCMLQYYQDNLVENRHLHNEISKIFQSKIVNDFVLNPIQVDLDFKDFSYHYKKKIVKCKRKLRVGFLISKLSLHSVSWLCRWFFKYYNQEKFDFYIYVVKQSSGDLFTRNWFESRVQSCRFFDQDNYRNINKSIYNDDIDILVDLDSTTSCESCFILALKPAPVQVTWLGFDASGIPAIDYFIADPYLLPKDAENYYSEKLWRLPQTYLAVDGFEIEVPTISRKTLDIPDEAIIYLSSQTGQKRNPETVRLQLRILKGVPNSYLIIKGWGEMSIIEDLFTNLAQEEGVNLDRLRFLPVAINEFIHRANLQVADVILDTYPYNGATTTLEALWVGVPIVTRVGNQCAARNSYTFLVNVGVTDGIATTNEEYINWGIRFGLESRLRQKVSTQLRLSRHTSCIWDTKKFAHDMENAFEEMWNIYTENITDPTSI